jgi:hypothetical protein
LCQCFPASSEKTRSENAQKAYTSQLVTKSLWESDLGLGQDNQEAMPSETTAVSDASPPMLGRQTLRSQESLLGACPTLSRDIQDNEVVCCAACICLF